MIPGTEQIHVILDAESLNISQKSVIIYGPGVVETKIRQFHNESAAVERIATEFHSEQRHERVVISSCTKSLDHTDRMDRAEQRES